MNDPMTHERARRLAAVRLDQALPPGDEVALDAHLATCADCRAVGNGYEEDRLALRAMPPIEPPRDLWARTSAALEREHARHPGMAPRGPRRWGPVAVLVGGAAVLLVVAIVGPGLLEPTNVAPGPVALASSGSPGPIASAGPVTTPIAVPSSEVTWVVTRTSGGLSLITASVSQVCPTGDEPDCAVQAGMSRSLDNLPTVPSSVVLSPSNSSQAVAIGPALGKLGTTVFVMSVPPAPASSPPTTTPAPSSSSSPATGSSAGPSSSSAGATPTPLPTHAAGSVTPSLGTSPSVAPPSNAVSPPASGTPAPSAAATLAILSGVTLVGDEAAYSGDGQWFAFSARPAGTLTGPDIYLWQAGWPAARPITSDHGSVFSGWVAGRILASRALPIAVDESPAPSPSPAASTPAASVSPATTSPAETAPASPSPATGATQASIGPSATTDELATPAAYLIDPASGQATRIAGLDGWRPVVDPSGRWVAYWAGTLRLDPTSGQWLPLQGGLEVASWATVSAASDASGVAAAHALPVDVAADWDIQWDHTGEHLGVWVADSDNPGLGSLSLLTIDPTTGQAASPSLLLPTPALRGFALKDGQLVWATPPGQDGLGSHLSILAWTGANAGKTMVEPVDGGAVIVVPAP